MELPSKACWSAHDLAPILGNEALEGHEGVFLATHTPVEGFAVAGSHAGELATARETAVLEVLSDDAREHAFCVVQGEPGSGKSHLIRWLDVNWPHGRDVKLLIQRADGSLEGALRQLRANLPLEFQTLFDSLGRRHLATTLGRANLLLGNLASALDPGHFDPPLADVEWCRRNCPHELLNHPAVRRGWGGPLRIINMLEGRGPDGLDDRNSTSARFDLFDIADLAAASRNIRGTGVLPATELLASRLQKEADGIEDHRAKGWTAEEVERDGPEFKTSIALLGALNLRRNDAVQNLLGVSAEGLKTLFRRIRAELERRGQRLVLLLEDITSWEGIDDSLIDVLVTNAGTRAAGGARDMCPLISVVGVTPAYYGRLHANYRGRITHELVLGVAQADGGLQDVATLRERDARLAFAARYLAAVRVGPERLAEWREALRVDHARPAPNRCIDCVVREGCHRTFGHVDGVGVFPFTRPAIERFFRSLDEHDNGMTWRTPRGFLQAILSPNLSRPDAIEACLFPTPLIENKALPPDTRMLASRLERALGDADLSDPDRERMRRLLAYWGDRERADTVVAVDGGLAFADVPQRVFEVFGLPWLGAEEGAAGPVAAARAADETVLVEPAVSGAPEEDLSPAEAQPADAEPRLETGHRSPVSGPPKQSSGRTTAVAAPPSKRRTPSLTEIERLRSQLRIWRETGVLDSPAEWNTILYDLVRTVDPRRAGVDAHTFERLLTREQVKIEGTGPARRAYFSVGREQWVWDGFEAYIALVRDAALSRQDAEFHRRSLTIMMRRLEGLVSAYADRRLGFVADGARWAPVATFVQILLARDWLRGVVKPEAPLDEQLTAILSDEDGAVSDPLSRCAPWQEVLSRTNHSQRVFREAVRTMLGTPQGDSSGFGLADLSLAAGAFLRLRATLRFDPVPAGDIDHGVAELNKAREIASDLAAVLPRALRVERDQVRQRAETIRGALRGRSINSHFERLDRAIGMAAGLLNAAPSQVDQWKAAHARLRPRLEGGADRLVEDAILLVGDDAPTSPHALLGLLAGVPARDLEEVRQLAQQGEQVVALLAAEARSCLAEGAGATSIDEVRRLGVVLRAAAGGHGPDAASQAHAA